MSVALVDKRGMRMLSPDNPRSLADPSDAPDPGPAWRPAPALRLSLALVATCLLLAVILARPDLVVLAAPFAIGTLAALAARPRTLPQVAMRLENDRLTEGEEFFAELSVTNPDPVGMTTVVHAVGGEALRLRDGHGRFVDPLPPGDTTTVGMRGTVDRWGIRELGPMKVTAFACDGLLRSRPQWIPAAAIRVAPRTELFDSRTTLPDATGMAGIHRSRRVGDGGELAEVRRYQPGDRLRRIDWRTSLRQRELHVNTTLSERDADVVLLLDVLHEAESAHSSSILDQTVRVAAALTEHYVQQGDRVAIVEFGNSMRRLRPGTGRRHFHAAREWLVDVRSQPSGQLMAGRMVATGHLPSSSVVMMLTPLIDITSTEAAARLVRSGRRLLTVDTLPSGLVPPDRSEWTPVATRLWQLEREHTIARLREAGVPVAAWRGPGSLDAMLTQVARTARHGTRR